VKYQRQLQAVSKIQINFDHLTVTHDSPLCAAHLLLHHLPVAPEHCGFVRVHKVPCPHRDPLPASDTARRPKGPIGGLAAGEVVVVGGYCVKEKGKMYVAIGFTIRIFQYRIIGGSIKGYNLPRYIQLDVYTIIVHCVIYSAIHVAICIRQKNMLSKSSL
jgi:hypothetical protein